MWKDGDAPIKEKLAILESWKLAKEVRKQDLRRLGGTAMKSGKELQREQKGRC